VPPIQDFSFVYRRTTVLSLFLVLFLIQKFFCLECQQQNVSSSVIMALANKKLEEVNEKQNLQLRTGNNWNNY
jgi:hypothetical protein